jgi:hypothetical protein
MSTYEMIPNAVEELKVVTNSHLSTIEQEEYNKEAWQEIIGRYVL